MKIKKNSSVLLIGLLLLVALVSSLVLMMKNQDSRKGAAFAGADMFILGYEETLEVAVGSDFEIRWYVDSSVGVTTAVGAAKVSAARAVICYGPEVRLFDESNVNDVSASVEILSPTAFDSQMSVIREYDGKRCLNTTVTTNKSESALLSGMIPMAKIKFRAVAAGTGTFEILKDKSAITGVNVVSEDKVVAIGQVNGRDYKVSEVTPNPTATGAAPNPTATGAAPSPTATGTRSPVPTEPEAETAVLNFKVAFTGLRTKAAACGRNWPVDVIVLGGGETAVYANVALTATDEKTAGGEVVFRGSLPLTGFDQRENLAVFIKGPQHLQMKYGKDKQVDFYAKAGGEIKVSAKDSPIYDWTGYRILAGDVSGATAGVPDGRVDGRDFSYIKSKISVVRTAPAVVNVAKADFDGDCMVGNVDLAIMMLSLTEKLSQLY